MQADNGTGIIKDDQEPQRPRQPQRHQPWSSSTVHAIEFSNHHHTPTTPTREPRQAVSGSKRKTYTTTPTHATPPHTTHPQTPTNTTPPPACRKPNTTPPNQPNNQHTKNTNQSTNTQEMNWSGFCSAFIVRRLVSPGSYSTRFRPARVSCSPGWRGGVSSSTMRPIGTSPAPGRPRPGTACAARPARSCTRR